MKTLSPSIGSSTIYCKIRKAHLYRLNEKLKVIDIIFCAKNINNLSDPNFLTLILLVAWIIIFCFSFLYFRAPLRTEQSLIRAFPVETHLLSPWDQVRSSRDGIKDFWGKKIKK